MSSSKEKIPIGTRVVGIGSHEGKKIDGLTGRIIDHNRGLFDTVYTIEFDQYMGGHSGGSLGKQGHCWKMYPKNFKVIPVDNETASELLPTMEDYT